MHYQHGVELYLKREFPAAKAEFEKLLKIVPDDKQVHVKDGDEFWAIPGDDNS